MPCFAGEDTSITLLRCYVTWKYGRNKNKTSIIERAYEQRFGDKVINVRNLELLCKVGITIFDDKGTIIRGRSPSFSENIYVLLKPDEHYALLNETHIPRVKHYCNICNRRYTSRKEFLKHFKTANRCVPPKPKEHYVGGGFLASYKHSLWFLLSCEGITVPSFLKCPNIFAVFDFEARFLKEEKTLGKNTLITSELIPVSYAINSNIPNCDPNFFVNEDPFILADKFWCDLLSYSEKAYLFLLPRYRFIFTKLGEKMKDVSCELDQYPENPLPHEKRAMFLLNKRAKLLQSIFSKLFIFLRCLPVLGYNSQNFDVNLIKKYIIAKFSDRNDGVIFKRGLTYMCLSNYYFRFLDCCNYIAPGQSLVQFLSSHLPELAPGELKGVWCYEYLDDYRKLSETELPNYDVFFSSLKQKNVSKEEYKHAIEVWNALPSPKTLLDYLKWYNELDVKYMVIACNRLGKLWGDQSKIDPFRNCISLPGISQNLLFRHMKSYASVLLPTKKCSPIQKLFEDGIVGGPAIIFKRFCRKDETFIKPHIYGNTARLCKSVVTWDANSLYTYTLCFKEMPCENYIYFVPKGNVLRGVKMHTYYYEEMEWLSWTEEKEKKLGFCSNHHILHQFNGGPAKFYDIPVDGFCESCKTIYCYNGSKFHGYCEKCIPQNMSFEDTCYNDGVRGEHEMKFARLASTGLRIISVCSCSWQKEKNNDENIRIFCLQNFPRVKKFFYEKDDILSAVASGSFFGILRVKIRVPENLLKDTNSVHPQFPPFFCNMNVPIEKLTNEMQEIGRKFTKTKDQRVLMSCLEADRLVVISPLLKYYLELGFQVDEVYEAVQMTGKVAFQSLGEKIYELRKEAEMDETLKPLAATYKLAGNSCYGKTVENQIKHKNIRFVDFKTVSELVHKRTTEHIETIDSNSYEVIETKKNVQMTSPKALGVFILGYAKLHLLRFAHMISKFVHDFDFAYILTDTDSLMVELSVPDGNLDSVIKEEMKESWIEAKKEFFPSSPSEDKKPGLFKVEFCGTACVALAPKTYIAIEENEPGDVINQKCSHKGTSKRSNSFSFESYRNTLFSNTQHTGTNRGFKRTADGRIFQYQLSKVALSPFYRKRLVCPDGIHTEPIRWEI